MDSPMEDVDVVWAQIEPIILETLEQAFPDYKELVGNLSDIARLATRVRLTGDEAPRKLGLDFLYEAERDLKSCKVLYSKRLYPHATYHLQQAVEKAAKGYVLALGFYEAHELGELHTHLTPEVFLKTVLERTGIKRLADQLTDETLKIKIGKAEREIDEEDERLAIARSGSEDIRKLLSKVDVYRRIGDRITTILIREVSNVVESEFLPPPALQTISSMTTIFILAVVTFPHEAYTRYPGGRMSPRDYTDRLGVVRAIPRMMKYLKPEIEKLKRMLPQ